MAPFQRLTYGTGTATRENKTVINKNIVKLKKKGERKKKLIIACVIIMTIILEPPFHQLPNLILNETLSLRRSISFFVYTLLCSLRPFRPHGNKTKATASKDEIIRWHREKKGRNLHVFFFFFFLLFYYFTTTRSTKRRRRWRRSYYGKSAKCQDTGAEESVRFRGRRKGRRTAKLMKTDAQYNDKQFVTESASQVSFFLLLVVGSQGRSVVADPTKSQAKNKSSVCANWWHPSSYFFYYRFQNKSNVLVSFFLLYYRIKKRVIDQESIQRKESKRRIKKKRKYWIQYMNLGQINSKERVEKADQKERKQW